MTDQDHNEHEGKEAGPPRPGADPPTEPAPTRELPETGEAPAGERGPRRLLRSRNDRVIAGVAGGFGRYFNVDPVIFRIAFAISILFGGLGIVAYLAVALFVPADDGSGTAQAPRLDGVARVVGVTILALIAVFGFGVLASAAAFVTGLGYGLWIAVLVAAIGLLLVAFAFRGGGAKWLIVPAIALGLGTGVAAAADLDLDDGIGERDYRPLSASEIPADGYRLGVGRLAVDLREIDWAPDRVVDLDVDLGFGEAVIAVPADVCVVADAHAGAGELSVAGERADGLDIDLGGPSEGRATPQLRLDADVSAGRIVVVNDDLTAIEGDRDRFDHDFGIDSAESRDRNERACAA